MLESIALAAGYRVGLYSKPHLVHFEERCRIGGEKRRRRRRCCRTSRRSSARGDISLTYSSSPCWRSLAVRRDRSTSSSSRSASAAGSMPSTLSTAIARSSPASTSITSRPGHGSRIDRPRESGDHAGGQAGDRQRPGAAAQRDRRGDADRRRPVAGPGATFAMAATRQQWNWSGRDTRPAALGYPALRGANQLLTRQACWLRSRRCASGCRSARRRYARAWPRSSCRGDSRRCRASRRSSSMSPTTRMRSPRWR